MLNCTPGVPVAVVPELKWKLDMLILICLQTMLCICEIWPENICCRKIEAMISGCIKRMLDTWFVKRVLDTRSILPKGVCLGSKTWRLLFFFSRRAKFVVCYLRSMPTKIGYRRRGRYRWPQNRGRRIVAIRDRFQIWSAFQNWFAFVLFFETVDIPFEKWKWDIRRVSETYIAARCRCFENRQCRFMFWYEFVS